MRYDEVGPGRTSTVPLIGLPDGDDVPEIASNWGSDRHPSWYHNLRATPEASISVDGRPRRVRAREAGGAERARLWDRGLEVYPGWSAYEERAGDRRIPVMVLEPLPTVSTRRADRSDDASPVPRRTLWSA